VADSPGKKSGLWFTRAQARLMPAPPPLVIVRAAALQIIPCAAFSALICLLLCAGVPAFTLNVVWLLPAGVGFGMKVADDCRSRVCSHESSGHGFAFPLESRQAALIICCPPVVGMETEEGEISQAGSTVITPPSVWHTIAPFFACTTPLPSFMPAVKVVDWGSGGLVFDGFTKAPPPTVVDQVSAGHGAGVHEAVTGADSPGLNVNFGMKSEQVWPPPPVTTFMVTSGQVTPPPDALICLPDWTGAEVTVKTTGPGDGVDGLKDAVAPVSVCVQVSAGHCSGVDPRMHVAVTVAESPPVERKSVFVEVSAVQVRTPLGAMCTGYVTTFGHDLLGLSQSETDIPMFTVSVWSGGVDDVGVIVPVMSLKDPCGMDIGSDPAIERSLEPPEIDAVMELFGIERSIPGLLFVMRKVNENGVPCVAWIVVGSFVAAISVQVSLGKILIEIWFVSIWLVNGLE